MKLFRRVIFWCHLAAGVTAGAIVLNMSVTGVLLTYEKQIAQWSDTHTYRAAPPAGAVRLGPDAIVAAVQAANPATAPATITMWSDPQAPVSVVAGQRTMFVNAYTGTVLGEATGQPRAFFRKMTDWHRWLGVAGEGRATARMITGACNLAFLFLVASGFYLWFPRTWTWRQVRAVLWFKGGLRGKARDFNWHNAIGLWTSIPLFVVVLSGVVISYPWASDLVYRAAGEAPPARLGPGAGGRGEGPGGGRGGGGRGRGLDAEGGPERQTARNAGPGSDLNGGRPRAAAAASVDGLWQRAAHQVDGWRSISLRVPPAGAATAVFTIDRGTGGEPQKRGTLTLDTGTGEVIKWEPFAALSTGRRLRSYVRFAHTGEVAGRAGQTVAGLASLGASVLVYTGLALAVRRVWAWRRRRAAARTIDLPRGVSVTSDAGIANRDGLH
ncbi:MAG: PepSY-associated TM helix domain-containing protein [Acidobacteriota bacterium]